MRARLRLRPLVSWLDLRPAEWGVGGGTEPLHLKRSEHMQSCLCWRARSCRAGARSGRTRPFAAQGKVAPSSAHRPAARLAGRGPRCSPWPSVAEAPAAAWPGCARCGKGPAGGAGLRRRPRGPGVEFLIEEFLPLGLVRKGKGEGAKSGLGSSGSREPRSTPKFGSCRQARGLSASAQRGCASH